MRRRHPSKRELIVWLDGGAEDLDEHLLDCEKCAATIEDIERTNTADTSEVAARSTNNLATALAAVYESPDGLVDRMASYVAQKAESKVLFEVASDMFGAGIQTGIMLATEEQRDS